MTNRVDRRILDIVEALFTSSDLREVIGEVHGELHVLVPADVAALCLSRHDGLYDWFTTDCPAKFFDEYPTFAAADFVAESVKRRPNRVVLDDEMAPRSVIEANMMHRRAHELGLTFEQAMAVLVQSEGGHGGITLYRTRRRPFTEAERRVLQMLVRPLAHAITRTRQFGQEVAIRDALAACLAVRDAVVVFDASGRELVRSPGLEAVAARWFAAADRGPRGLPSAANDWRHEVSRWPADTARGVVHRRIRGACTLEVRAERLRTELGQRCIAFFFVEHATRDALPSDLAVKLTPRQREVADAILRGWDNRLIADELGCAVDTVKQHVGEVFARLGVDSRVQFLVMIQARGERRD